MASGRPLEHHFVSVFIVFLGHLPHLKYVFLQKIPEILTCLPLWAERKCVLTAYIIKSDDFPTQIRIRRKRYMARGSDPTFPAPVVRMTVVLTNSLKKYVH